MKNEFSHLPTVLARHLQSAQWTKSFTLRQNDNSTAFKLVDKVAAFADKLKLWEQRVNKGVFDMFQTLAETLKDSEPEQAFSNLVSSHLREFFTRVPGLFSVRWRPSKCKKIHLFSNQVNRPYLNDKARTNCWTLQIRVAWNVFLIQRLYQCFGWRLLPENLTLPKKYKKLRRHFRHPTYASLDFL